MRCKHFLEGPQLPHNPTHQSIHHLWAARAPCKILDLCVPNYLGGKANVGSRTATREFGHLGEVVTTRKAIWTATLAGSAALGMAVGQSECAYAAFTFTIEEQGADVIVTGSGSINLSGLSPAGTDMLPDSGFEAQL